MGQEQMNTPNSTNTVDMNFFKSLPYLLSNSYKNHPIKFWTNVGLLILSIGTLVIIRTDSGFIHSLLSNKTNQLINLYLDFVSALYIVGLIFYLYWKVSPIKKDLMLSGVIIFLILISITVALLLIPVYNGLRYFILPQMELALDEFGSFFASITGLLAFLAVLYTSNVADKRAKETIALAKEEADNNRVRAEKAEENNRLQIEESRARYKKDDERTLFFQLLDLHTKKVDSIIFKKVILGVDRKEIVETGFSAFKEYVELANKYLLNYLFHKYILSLSSKDELFPENINKKELIDFYKNIFYLPPQNEDFDLDIIKDQSKDCLDYDFTGKKMLSTALDIPIKNKVLAISDYKIAADGIRYSYNLIYKEYGYLLGHYFRNMFYILDTINGFDSINKKKYAKIFRAQLSRYEIALTLFNALSIQSSEEFIDLLLRYKILNGFYFCDLIITNIELFNAGESKMIKTGQVFVEELLKTSRNNFI